MEYDYIEQPGEPDVVGAIEAMEGWMETWGPVELCDIEKVLKMLQPEPVKVIVGEQYDHRGHWHHAQDALFFTVPGIKDPFKVLEAWAYDIKPAIRACVGGTVYDFNGGMIEIWGRLLLHSNPAEVLLSESDGRTNYFDLTAGDSKFYRCKAKRIEFNSETSVRKLDFIALRAENFGYVIE